MCLVSWDRRGQIANRDKKGSEKRHDPAGALHRGQTRHMSVVMVRLSSTTFKYIPLNYGDDRLQRPALEIRMTQKYSINIHALVDSGATHTFLPKRFAKLLGFVDEGNFVNVQHIADRYKVRHATVKSIEIMQGQKVFENMRDQTVLIGDSEIQFCILGRMSLFKRFDITFSEKRRKLTLTRA